MLTIDTTGEGGNPTGRAIYRYIYYNLHTVFEANGYDTALAHQVNDEFGSLLATDGTRPSDCLFR